MVCHHNLCHDNTKCLEQRTELRTALTVLRKYHEQHRMGVENVKKNIGSVSTVFLITTPTVLTATLAVFRITPTVLHWQCFNTLLTATLSMIGTTPTVLRATLAVFRHPLVTAVITNLFL
jgi:hypothetical protein